MIKIISIISIVVSVMSAAMVKLTDIFSLTDDKISDIVLESEVNNG